MGFLLTAHRCIAKVAEKRPSTGYQVYSEEHAVIVRTGIRIYNQRISRIELGAGFGYGCCHGQGDEHEDRKAVAQVKQTRTRAV
ncbi:MAG TPA: hypothetical protein VKB96_02635 [Gammaproteobacteria bacterium]|nr:hypothetical protein [Gammaproteobacteria bacterium]